MKSAYRQFLESKIVVANRQGFDVSSMDIHPASFPHQKDAVKWAAGLGRALIAMKLGRLAYGIELNPEYYKAGLKYCEITQQEKLAPTLFDYLETMQKAEAVK